MKIEDRRSNIEYGRLLILGLGAALLFAGGLRGEEALPIKGLRIPLEHFEDGRIKMQFAAAEARAPEGGEVEAVGALVEIFSEDGTVQTRMKAETCRFNRATRRVQSDSAVRLERADVEITGVGLDWKTSEEKIRVLSQVRVVLKGSRGLGRVLPGRGM